MKQPIFIDNEKAQIIHKATIEVLEKTGIQLDNKQAENILLENGAKKDKDGRILIPGSLVESALAKSLSSFTLYDRNGNESLIVEEGRTYFGPGSDALYQRDLISGEIRESCLEDITNNVKVADALEFDFIMSMALPRHIPEKKLYPAVFAEVVKNTHRPIVFTAINIRDVRHIHKIAQIAQGEKEIFKPFMIAYVEPISPLRLDNENVENLIYCADNDIPFLFAAGANCGTGSPITPEGGIVQGGAESLAGFVIAILRNPSAKFIYGANVSSSDMRSGFVCYGASEWSRTVAMTADMGTFYNLPSWGAAGCTDALEIDAQAAWEAYRGIMMALLSESTFLHDMGYMSFGELYDLRFLVLVAEMLREAKHMLKPIDISRDSLAIDTIDEVARSASLYLAHPHTKKYFRKSLWLSKLINRNRIGQEHTDIKIKLEEKAKDILANHKPDMLDDKKRIEIEEYLESI
ncbi:MAG: trimethylamine methyltransferase family protein [Candidatus Eremiobacteraeota bacterium]|nr:trimethylamine methyltransferase family protein [Candidatus Eremiobacteraeota bacterium]